MEFNSNSSMSSNDSWINDKSSKVEFEGLDLPAGIITGILLTFIISITILGNLLVLIAIYVYHHLRTTTNFFILNLACADLFLGLSVLPFSASLEILGYWPFGRLFCVVWASVDVLLCTASIMTLCVISVDRYIGVTRPLQHSNIMTKKRAYSVIFSVWILSFAISVGPLMGWKPELDPDPRICQVNDQFGYVLFSTAGSFYIPMAIIIFVYIRIYKEAVKHTSQLMAGMKMAKTTKEGVMLRVHVGRNSQYSSDYRKESYDKTDACNKRLHPRGMIASKITKFKREKKAAKTLGIVVGVFILCWFPFFFCLPLGVLCQECHIPDLLFKVIFWLGYCNSMMNPVIYGFSSREFKRAFKKILHCQHRTTTKHIKKGLDSSASLSDINHSPRNMIQRDSCTTGSRKYPNIALNNSSFDDNPVMSETIIDSPNSLSPPGRSHSNSYTNGTWRQQSCDSECASLSENQFEALRLEQLEHYSTL